MIFTQKKIKKKIKNLTNFPPALPISTTFEIPVICSRATHWEFSDELEKRHVGAGQQMGKEKLNNLFFTRPNLS